MAVDARAVLEVIDPDAVEMTQLDRGVAQGVDLPADVPLLNVRSPQVGIEGEEGGGGIGQDAVPARSAAS